MKDDNKARAIGKNLEISTKKSYEVCNMIRGKSAKDARKMLEEVLQMKRAVPFRRYNMDTPHQKGKQGPGKYPLNVVKGILNILNSAVSNAEDKGLRVEGLVVENAISNKGPTTWRYGRQIRRQAKRTHIEIVVKETAEKKREVGEKKEAKPEAKKEVKAEEKKEEKPKAAPEKTKEEKPKEIKKEENPKEEKKQ